MCFIGVFWLFMFLTSFEHDFCICKPALSVVPIGYFHGSYNWVVPQRLPVYHPLLNKINTKIYLYIKKLFVPSKNNKYPQLWGDIGQPGVPNSFYISTADGIGHLKSGTKVQELISNKQLSKMYFSIIQICFYTCQCDQTKICILRSLFSQGR